MKKSLILILTFMLVFLTGVTSVFAYDPSRGAAYSIGTDYSGFWPWEWDIDTSGDATLSATTFGSFGFNSYYNIQPTYQYMRGNNPDSGVPRMESKILFFSGHANYDHMAFNYKNSGGDYRTGVYYGSNLDSSSGYKYAGIYSYNMSKVKLIIFGGCYTALGSDNIAKRANTRGARTSLGWTVSIGASSHSEWFDNFLYRLSGGRTVQAAVNYANDFSYDDNGVKNVVIYGDGNYVPSWDNGVATYSLPSNLRSDNKRYEVSIELENNYTIDNIKEKIDSYIKNNLDNEFDINNYQYDITGTGNKKYYDFKLLINGAISDSAYTVIVENNEIVAIVDNTKEISNNISTYSSNNINSDEQEELANKIKNNIIEENSNYEVISQKLKNIYISEENAYKTLILTEVHDKLTDSYFVKEDIL